MANRNVTLDDLRACLEDEGPESAMFRLHKIVQARVDKEEAEHQAYEKEQEWLAQVERDRVCHYFNAGYYLCEAPYDPEAKHSTDWSNITCPECRSRIEMCKAALYT